MKAVSLLALAAISVVLVWPAEHARAQSNDGRGQKDQLTVQTIDDHKDKKDKWDKKDQEYKKGDVVSIHEPATGILLGLGLIAAGLAGRRKRKAS